MHETMEKVKKICEIKDCIQEYVKILVMTDAGTGMNAEVGGQWIDMLKDCYQMEKDAWKAAYYKKMCEGMEPLPEEEKKRYMDGPFGYDNWRYSSGRFAPTGRGHFAGYMMDDEMWDRSQTDVYGYSGGNGSSRGGNSGSSGGSGGRGSQGSNSSDYSGGSNGGSGNSGGNGSSGYQQNRYGEAFNNYENARRHYTESGNKEDKTKMDRHAKEHVMDAAASIKEMYQNGDPELKKEIKKHLTALVGEMPT